MLVEVREFTEDGERVVRRDLRSVVGLQALDECPLVTSDRRDLRFPLPFEVVLVVEDREGRPRRRPAGVESSYTRCSSAGGDVLWPPSYLIMGGRQHRRCAAPPRCERQTLPTFPPPAPLGIPGGDGPWGMKPGRGPRRQRHCWGLLSARSRRGCGRPTARPLRCRALRRSRPKISRPGRRGRP